MRYLSLFISINLIPFSVSLDDDTFLLANNDVLGTQNLDEWKLSPSNLDPGIGTGTGEGEFIAWNNNNDGALNLNHDTTVFNSNPNPNLLPADNTFLLPPATEGNPNKIDSLLTSCSSSTTDRLDARDDNGASCVPRLEFNLPSLPTLEQIEKAVDTPPDPGPKPDPSPANQITPFLRQDSKCPPPYPYQLCCICDDRMMYEVCQDCISYLDSAVCLSPHTEVCCGIYGGEWVPGSGNNLDEWLSGWYDASLNTLGGFFAEFCIDFPAAW